MNRKNASYYGDPNKPPTALQRARREKLFREKIKAMEFLYDWLDSGESLEGLAIRVDIAAAGCGLSKSHHDVWRAGLEVIRDAREQGVGREEVISYLRELAKVHSACE